MASNPSEGEAAGRAAEERLAISSVFSDLSPLIDETGIDDAAQRRSARLAFAVALFNLNAYEGGVAALHGEGDPAWSSDAMLALASRDDAPSMMLPYATGASVERAAPATVNDEAPPRAPSSTYGKVLGFDASFRGANRARH